jgi:hypothetical protein
MNKAWTEKDDALIREWAPKISLQRLAVRMKRTNGAISHRTKELNVQTFKTPGLTLKERQAF